VFEKGDDSIIASDGGLNIQSSGQRRGLILCCPSHIFFHVRVSSVMLYLVG